jgi:YtkA-like
MNFFSTLSILALLFVTAASHAAESSPDLTGASTKGLQIEIYSELSPLRINQIHSWHVRLLDRSGSSIAVDDLTVIGGMPEHDHGLPTQPQITERMENGDYLLEGVRFHMQGLWQLLIEFENNGSPDSATIDFNL